MILEEQNQQQSIIFQQFLNQLVNYLEDNRDPRFYVPQQRQIIKLKNNIISNTFIIYGTNDSGKTSSVIWAVHQQSDVQIIIINCQIQITQIQFISCLKQGIKRHSKLIKQQGKTQNILNDNIKFDHLNQHIISSGKRFVILIKKCQKIAQMKKPILFYNLLQWVNGPIKPYIGLVFLSRFFQFTQKLEKRVKSRLAARSITLIRPKGQKIIQIYLKRFKILQEKYQLVYRNEQKSHKRRNIYHRKRLEWIKKIISAVIQNKKFKQFIKTEMSSIHNKFLQCMKLCLIHNLNHKHMNLDQGEFNKIFNNFIQECKQYIGVNYNMNMIKQLSPYCILVLSIITYMGLNNRTPYKLSNIFQVYRQFLLNNAQNKFVKSLQFSKALFQNAFYQLLDTKVIQLDKEQKLSSQKQILLSMLPQNMAQIIQQLQDLPGIIKQIVKI